MKVINALIKKYKIKENNICCLLLLNANLIDLKISYKKLNIAPTAIEPKNILICKSKAIPIRITPI